MRRIYKMTLWKNRCVKNYYTIYLVITICLYNFIFFKNFILFLFRWQMIYIWLYIRLSSTDTVNISSIINKFSDSFLFCRINLNSFTIRNNLHPIPDWQIGNVITSLVMLKIIYLHSLTFYCHYDSNSFDIRCNRQE